MLKIIKQRSDRWQNTTPSRPNFHFTLTKSNPSQTIGQDNEQKSIPKREVKEGNFSPSYSLVYFNWLVILIDYLVGTARPGIATLVPGKLDGDPGVVRGHEVGVLPGGGVHSARGFIQVTVGILV